MEARTLLMSNVWAVLFGFYGIRLPFFVVWKELNNMKKVGILMGSESVLPVVEKAIDKLKEFGVPYEVHVYSAHRTPEEAREFSASAAEIGFGVIIAAAGMAAHLAGAVAANTLLPVIGIPVKASCFDGMDALLSTVMMPPGMPVATVGVNASVNAALLAIQIIALSDQRLAKKLRASREDATAKVLKSNKKIEKQFN